jgi:hypothetical protein
VALGSDSYAARMRGINVAGNEEWVKVDEKD